jgi:phosphonopyruvate decarboxylase
MRVAPLMGGASSVGLGIALAQPDKRVLDGDGSRAMQLGTLLTISGAGPRNFFHFVFNNGVLYEGGGRLLIAGGNKADFCGLACAAGYKTIHDFKDAEAPEAQMPTLLSETGPVFVRLQIELPPPPRWSANNPQGELPDWWFLQMHDDARLMKKTLAGADA